MVAAVHLEPRHSGAVPVQSMSMPVGQAGRKRKADQVEESKEDELFGKLRSMGWPSDRLGHGREVELPSTRLQ